MNKEPKLLKEATRTAIGSLTQLAAVGPQDLHIHYGTNETNKPQAFQFQSTYSQHTRFGLDCTSVYDLKSQNPKFGSKLKFEIPFEKQNMISSIIFKVNFPDINPYASSETTGIHYIDKLGYRLIKHVSFKINNEIIEQYTGQYMYLLHKLETREGYKEGLECMMGMNECSDMDEGEARTLYIPLHLWYSRTMQQFFPLLAFHNQKIYIEIEFESFKNLVVVSENIDHLINVTLTTSSTGVVKLKIQDALQNELANFNNIIDGEFYIDYIILDHIERDIYLKTPHDHVYNLSLLQSERINSDTAKVELHFNLPIKQLIFVITDNSNNFEFTPFHNARLLVGQAGNDTMDNQSSDYYSLIQNYYHNVCHPENENIYSYSFALNSGISEHNGVVHFGKLPTKILEINGVIDSYATYRHQKKPEESKTEIIDSITGPNPTIFLTIHIYARGYNVLRTSQGYGRVEFKA